jgi:hypothetical protein
VGSVGGQALAIAGLTTRRREVGERTRPDFPRASRVSL